MEIKYQCQKDIQNILAHIKPIDHHFEVSTKYLYGLDNDNFIKGFFELRKILIRVYQDMLAYPEEYGLILVDMDVSEYKNSKPRDSRASAKRLMALLHIFGHAGELSQNKLHITLGMFQDILKVKYVGFSWTQNVSLILKKLSEFGFEFIGLKGNSFDEKAQELNPDFTFLEDVRKQYRITNYLWNGGHWIKKNEYSS